MVTYDESHKKLTESGIDDIKKVLFSDDVYQIRQVLFCLDFYLDPYYKQRLPYENEIFELLQELVINSRDDEVINDCLQLLGDYACVSLQILEQGFDWMKDSRKPAAKYVLNQP